MTAWCRIHGYDACGPGTAANHCGAAQPLTESGAVQCEGCQDYIEPEDADAEGLCKECSRRQLVKTAMASARWADRTERSS